MAIKIEVLKTDVENKGKYNILNISYKTPDGKTDGKKIVSFDAACKPVYAVLVNAQPGDLYDVTSEKVGEYWKWTAIDVAGKAGASPAAGSAKAGFSSPKSTYETPEERAKKQVYIVRQSSLGTAAGLLAIGAKKAPEADEVVALAREFEAYVFDTEAPAGNGMFNESELQEPKID